MLSQLSYTPTVIPAFVLLPFESPVSGTFKTIQCIPRKNYESVFTLLKPVIDLSTFVVLPRKEVIQPHLPIRLPCYDFTPVIGLALDGFLLTVRIPASGAPNSHGVTGGVYKARERIHRGMLIRDY